MQGITAYNVRQRRIFIVKFARLLARVAQLSISIFVEIGGRFGKFRLHPFKRINYNQAYRKVSKPFFIRRDDSTKVPMYCYIF